jgi:hypothetical protein
MSDQAFGSSALRAMVALGFLWMGTSAQAQQKATIPNDLGLGWPWELVSMDFPPGAMGTGGSVTGGEWTRPYQVESVTLDGGKKVDRAWFVASVEGPRGADGKRGSPPRSLEVSFLPRASVADGLAVVVKEDGPFTVIANGVYEFRMPRFEKANVTGKTLAETPHWCAGLRTTGTTAWDGRAWFDGSSKVAGVDVKVLDQGPVKYDVRVTYRFEEPGETGAVEALPLLLGKQCHLWKPNQPPSETVPRRDRHYEVALRFVAGDPWIEVTERFCLPLDPSVEEKVHQYTLHWGKPAEGFSKSVVPVPATDFMPVDTATYVRWFEYDTFGGNSDQAWIPASPRPTQKGRSFARLRPRWNQEPGAAQDFGLTCGGNPKENPAADPEVPAVAVFAAFASKWVGPYAATISANVFDGTRGTCRFPMHNGKDSGGSDGSADSQWYGGRSYGLVVGKRKDLTSLNAVVRRHTDWTLTAQINKYILTWTRDPSKAGPNILLSKSAFTQLQQDFKAGKNTPQVQAVQEAKAEYDALQKELESLGDVKGDKVKEKQAGDIRKKLGTDDVKILKLVLGEKVEVPKLPEAGLWIDRRYQDDFLNPTSGQLRRIPGSFSLADLMCGGQPLGGAAQAVVGYVFTDLDHWPGWHGGWSPGNPNFHTDKYLPAVMAGAAMLDHPHAQEWLEFGRRNLESDLKRVLWAPDGVGQECPGYSGYSFGLQMESASLYRNLGAGNVVAENALTQGFGRWHRKLLTPVDVRLGFRHAAPHGDTHRWTAGMGVEGFGRLSDFWKEKDLAFASEMMGTTRLLPAGKGEGGLKSRLVGFDPSTSAMDATKMDWSSQSFHGFGAILRRDFGTDQETFLSMKAGPARGHDHNTELAYHYYHKGTPISLDYNCSYHPRGDSAALHNSMTFGKEGKLGGKEGKTLDCMEEIRATGALGAFVTSEAGELVVAEREDDTLTMYPWAPTDEFQRAWPTRKVDSIVHRRLLLLVRHPKGSPLSDYLVVREETRSKEPQQLNVHCLAREAQVDGMTVRMPGQWDQDLLFRVVSATESKIEPRQWYYHDEWMLSPGDEYTARPDETSEQWTARMEALKKEKGWKQIPGPEWKPAYKKSGKGDDPDVQRNGELAKKWEETIEATHGRALMPPPGWKEKWTYGECQVWLRVPTAPGKPITWVLYPYGRGTPEPKIENIEGHVRVTLGAETEDIAISSGGVTVTRGGQTTELLKAGDLPELGAVPGGAKALVRRL